ncbi:hypothetical protein [Mucilaginibacter sp. OK283]|uniref:hypothetical protein n=1 Tax=Mucilaginibacter sp. OK283 TaxID=1881049 RepID=UPI0008BB2ED5|nr:hypothetical protein [Mucilaginibacter sp. OK283]SEO61495.1 hypothetical protein SAMN05428947_103135 [Mucilaginibacter sp. OK283]
MKKNLLSLAVMLFSCHFSYAQWTTVGTVTTTTNTVGIGTTTPAYPFHIYNTTTRSTNSGSYADFGLESFNNTGYQGSRLYFGRSRGTAAAPLAVQNQDNIGWLDFFGHDGTVLQRSGQLILRTDGTPSSGVVPGAFVFTLAGSDGVNTERMRIGSNGNVGIGTNYPLYKLDVNGNANFGGGSAAGRTVQIKGAGAASPNGAGGLLLQTAPGGGLDIFATSTDANPVWDFRTFVSEDMSFSPGSTERMRISSAGNVGIGTTSPAAPLHVSKLMTPGAVTEMLRLEVRGNNSDELAGEGAAINFYTPVTPSPDALGAQIYTFRESAVNATSTTSLRFATNNAGTVSDKLVISGSGNVGIGTTDNSNWNLAGSQYKLAVGGSMIATAVTVKLVANWPDYVFKKDYTLPSLTDVKTYIDQNQHLPEIPSAQQMEKDGVNLGEMNKLLLKKVEELTLYLIEEEQKNKTQQEQLNRLTEQVKLLTKQKTQ